MSQVTLIATLEAKPGHEDELGRHLAAVIAPTRAEAGCIDYVPHRSTEDPSVWMFYENWRSQAELDAHSRSPHLQDLGRKIAELVAAPTEVRVFTLEA